MRKLTNVACGDQYTVAATLENVIDSSGGYFNITGADVWMEIQYGIHGQTNFTDEVHVPIGGGVLVKGTTGIRFRNFVAGSIATVTAALSEKSEPPIQIASTGQSAVTQGVGPTPNTTLPGSPADLQQAILTDSTLAPTFEWLLQFNAALAKWEFLGGSPAYSEVNTSQTTTSAAYTDLATVGPSFTIPRTGLYEIFFSSALGNTTAGNQASAAVKLGAAAAVDNDSIFASSAAGSISSGAAIIERNLTIGDILKMVYKGNVALNTFTFALRRMAVRPVLIS